MSDFSLMDAIESGIVKLPRVPVAENIPGSEMPMFRKLWENICKDMPKKGRGKAGALDPLALPTRLQTALQALYGHYEKTFKLWQEAGIRVPPCFIVVCNNTSTSKLVYDFISGFQRENDDGSTTLENGRLPLFRNFDEHGNPLPRPNTLLIDSEQLESREGLDSSFRAMAADEIERFRREIVERTGDPRAAERITDQELPIRQAEVGPHRRKGDQSPGRRGDEGIPNPVVDHAARRNPIVTMVPDHSPGRTNMAADPRVEPAQKRVLGRYVVADPAICHGQLTFRGTRIFVADVLEQVASGMAWESIVESWRGSVSEAAIAEAVRLAREALVAHYHELAAE